MHRLVVSITLLLTAVAVFGQIATERPVSTPEYGPASVWGATIASDGDGFLVIWNRGGGFFSSHISRDGTVQNPLGIFLPDVRGASLIWAGDRYLDFWSDSNGVSVVQLAADGHIIAPARVILRDATISGWSRPVASNGNITVVSIDYGYAVLDRDQNVINSDTFVAGAVYLTGSGEFVITSNGGTTRLDSSGRLAAKTMRGWYSPIACRASECITAFGDLQSDRFAVASYDPFPLVVGPAEDFPAGMGYSGLAATAAGYLLVSSTLVQRLDPSRHLVGPVIALPGTGVLDPTYTDSNGRIASNGRDVALLRSSQKSLTATIVTPTGVTQPATVAFSANAQYDIAIARGVSNYLTVWTEKDSPYAGRTYAGRLSLDGQPLDGRGTLLGSYISKPSVIFDGTSYLVTLNGDQPPYLPAFPYDPTQSIVRVDPATGAVMSVFRIGAGEVRIASYGSTPIVVWTESGNLVAAFLSPNGTVDSFPVFVAAAPPNMLLGYLSVAWNGTTWLLAWEEEAIQKPYLGGPNPNDPWHVMRAARLSAALIPLDTQPITISEPYMGILQPRVASDGRDFLVAWSAPYGSTPRVFAQRFLSTGAPANAETLLFSGYVRDLVWDGRNYNLAFQSSTTAGDLAVARLGAAGQPLETLAISTTSAGSVSLIPTGNGRILAAYTRIAFEPLYSGVERAFVGTPYPARGHAIRKDLP
jgi:hypothetical protein